MPLGAMGLLVPHNATELGFLGKEALAPLWSAGTRFEPLPHASNYVHRQPTPRRAGRIWINLPPLDVAAPVIYLLLCRETSRT